jgi:CCR4-NOT transcription complex subunit 1
VNYSDCNTEANTSNFSYIPSKYVSKHFKASTSEEDRPKWKLVEGNDDNLTCQISFTVPNDIKAPMFMYYKLTNFFQNHREYVESYDLSQLKGAAVESGSLDSDCGPLKTNTEGKPYYPCGLIANSLFNDTFSSPYNDAGEFSMTDKDISWSSDQSLYKKTQYTADQVVPPPNWMKKYPDGYTEENMPDLHTWEALQVWMRTAALPSFMKLALKNETGVLTKGDYTIDVGLNYPVSLYGGTKSIVLTTSTVIGGRNLSLGIAYLVVAGLAIVFAIIFLVKYVIQPRKLGDHSYLNFDRSEQQPSAMASRQMREIL